jgi:uncharacterized membrane protein (DUF4010 family)
LAKTGGTPLNAISKESFPMALASASATPLVIDLALLLGLGFFLGLAFEDVFSRAGKHRPGGIRTFPVLALIGGMLYLFDRTWLIPFTAGLVVLGLWLLAYFRQRIQEQEAEGKPDVGLMVPLLNVYAYALGAAVIALPHWVCVGATVVIVLLFTGREALHALAKRVEVAEIITAAQFLILTGLVLPLLPDTPVTTLTSITPHQAWLALLVVSSMSYASYLSQRYLTIPGGGLWMAALSGLYSSTATTVVLARQAKAEPLATRQAETGIMMATGIMYLRVLIIVSVFNLPLALRLAPALGALALAGFAAAGIRFFIGRGAAAASPHVAPGNPLDLGTAALFALLFVATSLSAAFVTRHFGVNGILGLAAVVGVTDIDPFVLSLSQGGVPGVSASAVAAAILIATSSNNLLKAGYALMFAGWRRTLPCALVLVALAAAGVTIAALGPAL